MLRKLLRLTIFVGTTLFLTSCFEIEERIKLNTDDSGTYRFSLDMSQLIAMSEALQEASDSTGESSSSPSSSEELFENADNTLAALNSVAGISRVINDSDEDRGVLAYQFDFKDINALNRAFRAMSSGSENPLRTDVFEHRRGQLRRQPAKNFIVDGILGSAQSELGDEEDEATTSMVMSMFSSGSYTLSIEVPNKVKKFDNEVGEVRDKNKVFMEVPLDEMMKHNEYLDYTLKYK